MIKILIYIQDSRKQMAKCDGESEKRSSGEKEEFKVSSTGYGRVLV